MANPRHASLVSLAAWSLVLVAWAGCGAGGLDGADPGDPENLGDPREVATQTPTGLVPLIDAVGVGCGDGNCVWITARSLDSDVRVDVFSAAGKALGSYPRSAQGGAVSGDPQQSSTLTVRLADPTQLARWSTTGLHVALTNPGSGNTSRRVFLAKEDPRAQQQAQPWAGTRWGVAYFVPGHLGDWIANFQLPVIRQAFDRDLATMAGLGVRVVKLAIAPALHGLRFVEGGGSVIDQATYDAVRQNVPAIIDAFVRHGVRPIVAFMLNELYLRGPNGWYPNNRPGHYEWAYGPLGWNGLATMIDDVARWERGIIEAIYDAGLDDRVLYFNLGSEMLYDLSSYGGTDPSWDAINSRQVHELPRVVVVPQDQRAMDAVRVNEAARFAADLPAEREISWTEVHAYPSDHEIDLAHEVDAARAALPRARVALGEFGADLCRAPAGTNAEDHQRRVVADYWQAAAARKVPLVVNWHLWDGREGTSCAGGENRFGAGFAPNQPRDVLGFLVDTFSALPGGDFENDNAGWTAGGSVAGAFTPRYGPSEQDAATGVHYLRLQIPRAGAHWVCSPPFAVTGQRRVAVTAYVRSTLSKVTMQLHYRDAQGWSYATGRPALSKAVPLSGRWAFELLQQQLGGFFYDAPKAASETSLCFVVDASAQTSFPVYLDLDSVSVNSF